MEPKWLTLALGEVGTKEIPGPRSNPSVDQYFRDAANVHAHDDVPWCAAFTQAMLIRSGQKGWGGLMARGALRWGQPLAAPIPGAIVVFGRAGSPVLGHVAFVVRDNGNGTITIVGGNQSDAVTLAVRNKQGVLGYRWPPGVAVPKKLSYKLAKGSPREVAMADMTPQQIMDAMSAIYRRVDRWGMGDLGEIKQAVKKSVECMFNLAKLHLTAVSLPGNEPRKAMKKGLTKPPRLRKAPMKRKRK